MKKCPNCHEKTFEQVENTYVCSTCNHVQGNKDKLINLKKVVRSKSKDNILKIKSKELQILQEQKTGQPYLRFRIFRIDVQKDTNII